MLLYVKHRKCQRLRHLLKFPRVYSRQNPVKSPLHCDSEETNHSKLNILLHNIKPLAEYHATAVNSGPWHVTAKNSTFSARDCTKITSFIQCIGLPLFEQGTRDACASLAPVIAICWSDSLPLDVFFVGGVVMFAGVE